METVLRSETEALIAFLPVRHHSPACAYHLKQTIDSFLPDIILIEGPKNANALIPVMVHDDTKPPFAVYYSYDDKTGRVSGEKRQYKCYYPFLEYSPELAALRCARERGIDTAFIDMPYGDILAVCKAGKGLLREDEKNNYNDDYLLSRNAYIHRLCEESGVRSFDEFWEKYFEINGMMLSSEKWFSNLLLHCRQARENSTKEDLQAEGCIAREAFMAEEIKRWSETKKRILVVTGGFHTPALLERMSEREDTVKEDLLKPVPEKDQGVFLMPYSMEAADALNGYASGMPFPEFYQTVWEFLETPSKETAYQQAVLEFLLRTGRGIRKQGGNISTYDVICADAMTGGLSALRGKQQPGAYELLDAALSSFVKGEYNIAGDEPMRLLSRLMTGNRRGKLCMDAEVPPIIQDFEAQCKRFRIKEHSTVVSEVTLSIFSKPKHRQLSMFFHRLVFLDTGFASRIKGPNLQRNTDRNLIREIWKYKWSVEVTAALIDSSVYGGTVEEAVNGLVREKIRTKLDAEQGALLLSRLFEMGMSKYLQQMYDRLEEQMLRDTDFFSLARALAVLKKLKESEGLYQTKLSLDTLLKLNGSRLIFLLPDMAQVKEEDLEGVMEAVKQLYQMTEATGLLACFDMRESFLAALSKMEQDRQITPGLNGCIQGVLYAYGKKSEKELEAACRGYLTGTKKQVMKTAAFFRGLFYCAKDVIFIGDTFLNMLDRFLKQVDSESFMSMLPELRMAFTHFTPGEIDRIGAAVAAIYGREKESILMQRGINPGLVAYGTALDAYTARKMEEMGYGR